MEARCEVRHIRISPTKVGIAMILYGGNQLRKLLAMLRLTRKGPEW